MSCRPERVSGYVDGVLDAAERADVEAHLGSCPACRDQAASEREIRAGLRGLFPIMPRPGLEDDVRRRLTKAGPQRVRWLLPLAAGLAVLALWVRGAAPFVAWELARDHDHCFGLARLPAQVWSGDPARVASWFDEHGTPLPLVPASAGGVELVGGRYCPLADGSQAAHLYYVGEDRHVSLYVMAHGVRFDDSYSGTTRHQRVLLTRLGETTVGVVSERPESVEAFRQAFASSVAWDLLPLY